MLNDTISRQAAIDALMELIEARHDWKSDANREIIGLNAAYCAIEDLPSVEPTLYGYNIQQLALIAAILQKEDLPPERVEEALTDIGRILQLAQEEFIETLQREVKV